MLRANLRYFNVDRPTHSVLITSAAPGDGKSTVAWNLASAVASGGAKTVILEGDLRHPTIAENEGVRAVPGLSNVLAGDRTLAEVTQAVPIGQRHGTAPGRTVDVVTAGPLPPNPHDLIESDAMRAIIRSAERTYDLVVVDTPPTSVVSDAIPLVNEVSGVIVVARLGKSTRESLGQLRHQLANLDAPVLGVVVNYFTRDLGGYGYGYVYGYGDSYAAAPRGAKRQNGRSVPAAAAPPPVRVEDRESERPAPTTAPAAEGNGGERRGGQVGRIFRGRLSRRR
jgi:capsular exopolysaccharide synthesis family protein